MSDLKVTVLISGNGSNLQALIDARDSGRLGINIINVISNVADAKGLERAARAGIPSTILEHQRFADRNDFDRALAMVIAAGEPELVLAGLRSLEAAQEGGALEATAGLRTQLRMLVESADDEVAGSAEDLLEAF